MKIYFDTVGCRLNQAEIERMASEFRAAGYEIVESASQADLVIVNTCSVTAAAASDSRQKIRQANRAGVENIVATGCWATLSPQEALSLPGVKRVFNNDEKEMIPEILLGKREVEFDVEPLERKPLPGIHRRTRAFLKVQDGCSNHCTFCVTRLARGKARSIDKQNILNEVKFAEMGGAKEIVLSGVHLGYWGKDKDSKETISDLISFILENSQIPRIRLSSIEPWDLDDHFFDLWQNERMCRHLHLPLQSGSKETLKRMGRNTTPELYKNLVRRLREKISGIALTTDIIVGFPGETEEEFRESLDFVTEVNFAGGHVFRYSPRPGTPAALLPGRINGKISHSRSEAMRTILDASSTLYHQQFLNKEVEVLWESTSQLNKNGWLLHGLTSNYLPVLAWSIVNRWNEVDRVKLLFLKNESIEGEILH